VQEEGIRTKRPFFICPVCFLSGLQVMATATVLSICDVLRSGADAAGHRTTQRSSKVLRSLAALRWRQRYNLAAVYPLQLNNSKVLNIQQVTGAAHELGTGAAVWPCAVVLSKYLEKKYAADLQMKGVNVIELGSGTGCVGLVAAALGARVILTDQSQLLPLMQGNVDCNNLQQQCSVREFDWDTPAAFDATQHTSTGLCLVIASDCVVPQLYPLEPLVAALTALTANPATVALLSYEHRHHEHFHPRSQLTSLLQRSGLSLTVVPQQQHDAMYTCDDIEIWEVRALQKATDLTVSECKTTAALHVEQFGNKVSVRLHGQHIMLNQCVSISSLIGSYLWPSAVILSKYIATQYTPQNTVVAETPQLRVLELGAGIGLVSAVALALGWSVVSTDRETVTTLLQTNLVTAAAACTSSGGSATVVPYLWGDDTAELLAAGPFDRVLCADCVYAESSIPLLMSTLLQVCTSGTATTVIMTNEMRSAFDAFTRRASAYFDVQDVHFSESDLRLNTSSSSSSSCSTTGNVNPTPVALKVLTLKQQQQSVIQDLHCTIKQGSNPQAAA
jgi:predicted nicotinamide N-methyase